MNVATCKTKVGLVTHMAMCRQRVNRTVGVNRIVGVNRTVNTGINYGPSCDDQGTVMYVANEAPPSYINETQSRNRMPYSEKHEASNSQPTYYSEANQQYSQDEPYRTDYRQQTVNRSLGRRSQTDRYNDGTSQRSKYKLLYRVCYKQS